PLPVKVKSVMAKVSGGKVKLIIETATEEEGLIGFRIYKGESPDVFSIVGTYENDIRLRAKGTSGFGSVYEWEDFQIENGKRYFYRVSAVSRDGERMIDKVIEVNVDVPKKFALYQNYPNPFNPTTTIEFDIAKDAHVKLEIFNLSGEKVSEIINKKLEAGRYSIVVDFSNMPSGIYFYKLIADEFVEVKRMVFLK
ncbi:MAG: T9SS type A sorting domain-containing protein, partial [Candidatus Kryptonium sp.]